MPDNKPKKIDFDALKSSVYSYDKLQSQYGGQRFATRGAALSKERYNAAWEEYSKANPDAKKENFRNIYTTKAKDEENLTPWQQRARKDVQEAAALAEEDKASFRSKQQENFAGLDPEQRQIRGKKALQALQSLGGTKTDEIKKILKQVGSGPGVQRNRDLTDDEFAKVQSFLESRSGTAYADDANQILQGLYKQSPMKRYESPFKRKLDIQQGPNYADLSARIGQSVNSAIEEQRIAKDRAAEEERRAMMSEMQQLQLSNLKSQQYEALTVAGDTNIPSADEYIQNTSRQIVDKQAELVAQLKNNDISTDEFAQMSAVLKSQVPALKATKEALTNFQGTYQGLLESGQLSASDDGMSGKLYNAITSGDMAIEQGEDGKFYINGAEGELHMPLDQVSRLPKPTPKAQPLNILVKDVAAGFADRPTWDNSSSEAVKAQLDNMLSGGTDLQAEKTLKAIAVDSLGYSLEEANKLLNEQPVTADGLASSDVDGNTNRLEQLVEERMVKEAQSQWEANKYKRQQEEAKLAYTKAQTDRINRALNQQDPNEIAKINAENQQNFVTSMVNNKDLGSLVGQGGAATVAADPKGNPRVQYLLNSQGKPVFSVDWGKPNEAYNRIQNFLRAKERGEYQDPHEGIYPTTAPFKKNSPLKNTGDEKEKGWWETAKEYGKKALNFFNPIQERPELDPKDFMTEDGNVDLGAMAAAEHAAAGGRVLEDGSLVMGSANPFLGGPAGNVGKAAKAASKLKAPSSWGKRAGAEFKFADKTGQWRPKKLEVLDQRAKASRGMKKPIDDLIKADMLGKNKKEALDEVVKLAKNHGIDDAQAIETLKNHVLNNPKYRSKFKTAAKKAIGTLDELTGGVYGRAATGAIGGAAYVMNDADYERLKSQGYSDEEIDDIWEEENARWEAQQDSQIW